MNHPSAYRVKVVPTSGVDYGGAGDHIWRATVEEVGQGLLLEPDDAEMWGRILQPGNIVYYQGGIKIEDAVYVETTDVVAYESVEES
jgi:hypothetical protein